ncbi:MAG: formylglycine-generating enzyme family protein [Magnetococcales bacterium]|nr:formylglycine-generating enzyme family protein [Magnetococcales bacterium]
MGRDRFGLWAEFVIGKARQKMRWIPPGRLTMGSLKKDKEGRLINEGPQHEVILENGYWLFDTPCTQALWQAVMIDNPSGFKSPNRPVEVVSWDDVQEFLKGINMSISGLNLALPSEAQWEYACRAGTTTALYTGDIQILGEHNAPALDPIAWYGGNSGVDFELSNAYNSKDWPEKQYVHERAGSHPVGLKAPNAWGLYDMLGNVWEWCADYGHESYVGVPTDGTPRGDAGSAGNVHVIRGGSWVDGAFFTSPAFRTWNTSDRRSGNLGFRCARVGS